MGERDIPSTQPLVPMISKETLGKLGMKVMWEGVSGHKLAEQGRSKMEQHGQIALLELLGEMPKWTLGGYLGYYVLWSESIKKGSLKLSIVSPDTINDRLSEVSERNDEAHPGFTATEDDNYLTGVTRIAPEGVDQRNVLNGAIVTRDMLRTQAENDQIRGFIQS